MHTRKTSVTVESHQLLILRRGNRLVEDWCTQCGKPVTMATADEATVIAGVAVRAICRRVELGELHFKETGDGLLFICLNSLVNDDVRTLLQHSTKGDERHEI